MNDYALGFSESQVQVLFDACDLNRNGLLEYDEFLRNIRGPMNESRKSLVTEAFNKLDKDGNGILEVRDLEGVYSGAKHPDVLQGKKTEQQIL